MTKSRTATVPRIALTLALACPLLTPDARAQLQESSFISPNLVLASRHRTKSTTDTLTTELRLPSESKATTLSLVFTVVPTGLGLALAASGENNVGLGLGMAGFGLFLGPSIGYFYGDCSERGMTGVGIRALVGVATVIASSAAYHANHDASRGQFLNFSGMDEGLTAFAIGAGLIGVLSLYDIARVDDTVEKQNRKRKLANVRLQPSLSADGRTVGITLSMAL